MVGPLNGTIVPLAAATASHPLRLRDPALHALAQLHPLRATSRNLARRSDSPTPHAASLPSTFASSLATGPKHPEPAAAPHSARAHRCKRRRRPHTRASRRFPPPCVAPPTTAPTSRAQRRERAPATIPAIALTRLPLRPTASTRTLTLSYRQTSLKLAPNHPRSRCMQRFTLNPHSP